MDIPNSGHLPTIATIQNQPPTSGHFSTPNNGQLRVHQQATVHTILPLLTGSRQSLIQTMLIR